MKGWIDTTRAACMLVIYLFHAYVYCQLFDQRLMGLISVTINVFVVVSGYLFYQNHAADSPRQLSLAADLRRVMSRLVWPTVLFAAVLFVPKMWFNRAELQWSVFFYNVLGGMTFWFTSALAVTQLLFSLLFSAKRIPQAWHLLLVLPFFLLGYFDATLENFPWHWKDGFEFTLYFALGGYYFRHERGFNILFRRFRVSIIILYSALSLIYAFWPNPASFLIFNVASFPMALSLFRCTPKGHRFLSFIGRNSLMFYLLCGLTPAAWTTLLCHTIGIHFWSPWVVFPLSLITSWLLVAGMGRYKILGLLLGIKWRKAATSDTTS